MSVVTFTFLILTLYLLGLKSLSYFAYRVSQKNTEDYFLSGRNVGIFALIATTAASIFSTATVVGAPADFFTKGTNFFWIFFFSFLPFIMMPICLKIWKIGKVKSFITPGELLGDFYKSKSVQFIAAAIGIIALFPYATAQIVAVGKLFDALTDGIVPYSAGVSIVAIAIGMYIWYGGSRAVIWTDMVQGVIFSLLLAITAFLAVKWAGGWDNVTTNLSTNFPEKANFDVDLKFFETIPMAMAFFFLPHVWQRTYMSSSAKNLSITISSLIFLLAILFFIAWVIGTSALAIFPNGLGDSDSLMGALFTENAPYFGAFVLVAAFAAGMSTIDSQLLSAGALLTHDIKRKIIKRKIVAKLKWRDNYKFARMATMFLLGCMYIWALTLQDASIIQLAIIGVGVCVIFFPTVLAIFYWKKASATAAILSMSSGLAVFLIKLLTPLGDYFPSDLGAISWAFITSLVIYIVTAIFTDSSILEEKRKEYKKILEV